MTQYRIWTKALAAFLILIIGIVGVWLHFLFTPLITDKDGLIYTVRSGSSISVVVNELAQQGVITNPDFFKLLVKMEGNSHQLKAGEYFFAKGTTPLRLLHQITTGEGIYYHTFTIIAGWNFKQIQKALRDAPSLQHKTESLSDSEIMHQLGSTNLKPEGMFFPDTYYYSTNATDIFLLKRAYQTMQDKLNKAWQKRDENLPFKTEYEALIVASMIEKEAQIKNERPRIAGVIINRLNKDMLLQIDPTVIYGMGNRYNGVIHKTDLFAESPYNTYVHKGLPPTPIAMPSQDSIDAALHPEKHHFYYFVLAGVGETRHHFSESLNEHNVAATSFINSHPEYFNSNLIRNYLLKVFSLFIDQ